MTEQTRRAERPLISLTMIVKNEEQCLAACLTSARAIADELIVVDTGSTDRTVDIAHEHGAIVRFFPWCDDFSAARNAALEHATGEWVLHLDADEIAVETLPGATRAELATIDRRVKFLRVPVRSRLANGQSYEIYGARRLFRNEPEIRWVFPIHENIVHLDGDRPEFDAACTSLMVDHEGYADHAERIARGKVSRNMRLLKRALREHPDEPTFTFYLAREHIALGHNSTALRLMRRAIRRAVGGVRLDFLGAMYCQAMRCALMLGQVKAAIRFGDEAVRSYAFSEVCYLLGCAYRADGNLPQAERYLELALALRDRAAEYQVDAGAASWKSLIELGTVSWARGDQAEALERWQRAHAWNPDAPLTNYALGRGLVQCGRPDEAVEYLGRTVEMAPAMRDAQIWFASALRGAGRLQEAYDHLDGLVRREPQTADYWNALGELLYEVGEFKACADLLGRAIEIHRDRSEIYARLGGALRQLGRYQDALHAYALAAALAPESTTVRAGLALAAHSVEWELSAAPA